MDDDAVDLHVASATAAEQPRMLPTHVRIVAITMVVQGVLYAWQLTSVLRERSAFLRIADGMGDVGGVYLIGWTVMIAWMAIGLVWTPVNAWGLLAGKPWARKSVIAYCALAIPTGCCMPFGAYGLYAMHRKDVREAAP